MLAFSRAPVAQLDRVPGYEPGGREFESLRARQDKPEDIDEPTVFPSQIYLKEIRTPEGFF